MENKFYKCKCNSGSFNGNCPVCEPKEEKVCERNCPDYNGMNILHKEDCNCSCHDEPKEEWICKECGHHKLSKVYCDHYCHIKKVEPKEEPKDVWAELKEQLADIEHQRWADWQKYMHSKILPTEHYDSMQIETEFIERWERQIKTDYKDLSEKEKDSDRKQVDRYLPLLKTHCILRKVIKNV